MDKRGITIVYFGEVPRGFGVESVGYTPRDEQIAYDTQPRKDLRQYAWIALTRAITEYAETNGCTKPLPRLLPNGKWVADNCYLSLSHTDGYVAAAVSDLPVGVDIERTNRRLAKGLYDRIVCGKEKALYAALDNTQLLQLWTAKEAVFKQTDNIDGLTVSQIDTTAHKVQTTVTEEFVLSVATDCEEVIIRQM